MSPRRHTMDADTRAAFTSALFPFAFAASTSFGAVPALWELEPRGWVRVGVVPGLGGVWVMRHGVASGS